MELSRQGYWSVVPWPPPADLPNPGNNPRSSRWQASSLLSERPQALISGTLNMKLKITAPITTHPHFMYLVYLFFRILENKGSSTLGYILTWANTRQGKLAINDTHTVFQLWNGKRICTSVFHWNFFPITGGHHYELKPVGRSLLDPFSSFFCCIHSQLPDMLIVKLIAWAWL